MVKLKGVFLFFAATWDCVATWYALIQYSLDVNQVAPKRPRVQYARLSDWPQSLLPKPVGKQRLCLINNLSHVSWFYQINFDNQESKIAKGSNSCRWHNSLQITPFSSSPHCAILWVFGFSGCAIYFHLSVWEARQASTDGLDPEVSPHKMTFLHISPIT